MLIFLVTSTEAGGSIALTSAAMDRGWVTGIKGRCCHSPLQREAEELKCMTSLRDKHIPEWNAKWAGGDIQTTSGKGFPSEEQERATYHKSTDGVQQKHYFRTMRNSMRACGLCLYLILCRWRSTGREIAIASPRNKHTKELVIKPAAPLVIHFQVAMHCKEGLDQVLYCRWKHRDISHW